MLQVQGSRTCWMKHNAHRCASGDYVGICTMFVEREPWPVRSSASFTANMLYTQLFLHTAQGGIRDKAFLAVKPAVAVQQLEPRPSGMLHRLLNYAYMECLQGERSRIWALSRYTQLCLPTLG